VEERRKKPESEHNVVKDESVIGSNAADDTSGEPESPEEWAESQPLVDAPTYALEPGDPTIHQPAAASPSVEKKKTRAESGSGETGD
jgi:hypothetical protein